jgi:hypothetical protein
MPPDAATSQVEEQDGPSRVFYSMIGSSAFRSTLVLIGLVITALLGFGAEYWAATAASKNPDVVGAVSDVAVLKTEFKVLQATANEHSSQLSQAAIDRQRSAEIQEKIFGAIKQIGNDVHAIDIHVATVDQKVDDLKEQVRAK